MDKEGEENLGIKTFHVQPEGNEELLKGFSRSVTGPNLLLER